MRGTWTMLACVIASLALVQPVGSSEAPPADLLAQTPAGVGITQWGGAGVSADTAPQPTPAIVTGDEPRRMGSLTFRERRRMGVTFRNVLRLTREMKAAGELEDISQSEVAAAVLERIIAENPQAFADPSVDWGGYVGRPHRIHRTHYANRLNDNRPVHLGGMP